MAWRRLRVTGTPAHGSMPFGADNALIKAAEMVRRLAEYRPRRTSATHGGRRWRRWTCPTNEVGLLDPARIVETIEQLPHRWPATATR